MISRAGRALKFGGAPADAEYELKRIPRISRTIGDRLRAADGYTLIELLTVMVLLGIVLGVIVTSFTIGIHQEVDQSRREGAYATARGALERLRLDIHCASGGIDSLEANPYGGFTLTLTESNDSSSSGWCPGVIPAGSGSSGVQWCTIPANGNLNQFRLYRFLGLDPTDCDGGLGSTFEADFITQPAAGWPHNDLATPVPRAGPAISGRPRRRALRPGSHPSRSISTWRSTPSATRRSTTSCGTRSLCVTRIGACELRRRSGVRRAGPRPRELPQRRRLAGAAADPDRSVPLRVA